MRPFTKDLVSVIIPIYNDHRFLVDALDSAMAQSYASFEIIVVDDGSSNSDEIQELVAPYLGDKCRYIRNPLNVGLAASRNVGIRNSKGEFVCFLDADDLFAADKLMIQVKELRDRPELLMVFSNEYIMRDGKVAEGGHPVLATLANADTGQIRRLYARQSFIAVFTVMLRHSVFDTVGYFENSLRAWEDDDFWFRIMLEGDVSYSSYISGYRRLHDSNMSGDRHVMNYYALKTFNRWARLCTLPDLKLVIKKRAYNTFKIYLKRGIEKRDFRPEALRLIFGIMIS